MRPYVLLSCAVSVDGYLDDASPDRLILSNAADLDRVDGLRSGCDAILVGAGTVRRDDPRLIIRSAERRRLRVAQGRPPDPVKATVTGSGRLDPAARFFTTGTAAKLVYCSNGASQRLPALAGLATVVPAGEPVDFAVVLADLWERGVRRLLVEGGGVVHSGLLAAGLADELQLVVAPFFVGDPRAPRFLRDGPFPWGARRPMTLADTERIGDLVLLRYLLPAPRDG